MKRLEKRKAVAEVVLVAEVGAFASALEWGRGVDAGILKLSVEEVVSRTALIPTLDAWLAEASIARGAWVLEGAGCCLVVRAGVG